MEKPVPTDSTGNFYPRSPRGERLDPPHPLPDAIAISIHAPREGSDGSANLSRSNNVEFLSTLPARGATLSGRFIFGDFIISIHAPREGSDSRPRKLQRIPPNFYPRSPRGERHRKDAACRVVVQFLSTLPARGATPPGMVSARKKPDFYPRSPRGERLPLEIVRHLRGVISIHAPREGSDLPPKIISCR